MNRIARKEIPEGCCQLCGTYLSVTFHVPFSKKEYCKVCADKVMSTTYMSIHHYTGQRQLIAKVEQGPPAKAIETLGNYLFDQGIKIDAELDRLVTRANKREIRKMFGEKEEKT